MLLEEVISFKSKNNQKVFQTAKDLLSKEKDAKVMDIEDVVDPLLKKAQELTRIEHVSPEVRRELLNWFKTIWTPPNKR